MLYKTEIANKKAQRQRNKGQSTSHVQRKTVYENLNKPEMEGCILRNAAVVQTLSFNRKIETRLEPEIRTTGSLI